MKQEYNNNGCQIDPYKIDSKPDIQVPYIQILENKFNWTNVNPTQAGSAWQVSWHFSGLSKSTNTLQEKTRSVFQVQVPPVYVVLVPGGVTFEAGGNRQVPRAEWKRQGREGENQAELQK